jgi:hypothetical protein
MSPYRVSLAKTSTLTRILTRTVILAFVLALLCAFTLDAAHAAEPGPMPDPQAASNTIDAFTGFDFAEFWWDAAQIPGCADVQIHRNNQLLTTVPCAVQPWRNDNLQPNTAYTFRFYFMDAEGKTLPPQLGVGALVTPGTYAGTLHTNLTISGGNAQAGQIRLAPDASLTIESGVTVVGGVINDDAGRQDTTCSGEAGRLTATAVTFQDTVLHLCNPASALTNNLGNAAVNLFAPVTLKANTLGSVYANIESSGQALLEANTFPTDGVDIDGPSDVRISDCDFQQGGVKFRGESSGILEKSTLTSQHKYAVELLTARHVTVRSNQITLQNAENSAAAVLVDPAASPHDVPEFDISFNTIAGSDSGTGIQVSPHLSGHGDASISITQNTVARFAQGIRLEDGCRDNLRISAVIQDNSIVNAANYGVSTSLCGSEDSVSLTGNCLADNANAFYCNNPDIVVDATGNYWGHESGPSHSSNPAGEGDLVYCNEAQIDVSNWLQSHTCTVFDLEIAGIEVVQSVQTADNAVPLVQGKETVVRVYPGVTAGSASGVTAELTGFRDGAQLGTLQHPSTVSAGVIDDWDAVRGDKDSSLNFTLPKGWLRGTVDLVATLDASLESSALDLETPRREVTIGFTPRRKLKIAYIPVTVDTGPRVYTVNAGDVLALHKAMVAIFPLGDVDYKILPEETIFYDGLPLDDRGVATGAGFVHYSRQVKSLAERYSDFEADLYITVNGIDGDAFAFSDLRDDLSVGQCSSAEDGRGCLYFMGLNLGLRALRKDALQEIPFGQSMYQWPYADATTQEYGYDTTTGIVTTPDYWDVMSHEAVVDGLSRWISPFHYQKVFENLDPNAGAEAQSQAAMSGLWVTGVAGRQSGHLYPVTPLDGATPSVTPEDTNGAYCVQSVSGNGAVLDAYCFDLDLENSFTGNPDGSAAFGALLAHNAATAAIRLRYAGETLAQIDVPAAPPVIQLHSAAYVPKYGGLDIAWTVTAGDAASLRYTFLYSPDNGVTWQPLAVHPDRINWFDGAFHWGVRLEQVPPGDKAKVRILASDGYHVSDTTSDPFTVPDAGPWTGISAPANNASIDTLPLTLQGFAYDVLDGDRGSAIEWTSDIDGKLGNGAQINAAALSPGPHTITLTASDKAGNVGSAQIRVFVQSEPPPSGKHRTYLPALQK